MNYCPNCGHQLTLTNHQHETDTTPIHYAAGGALPTVVVTPAQAARAARPRLPRTTHAWLRVYAMIGVMSIICAIVFGSEFLIASFAIMFLMIGHGLYASSRMTWDANNTPRHL